MLDPSAGDHVAMRRLRNQIIARGNVPGDEQRFIELLLPLVSAAPALGTVMVSRFPGDQALGGRACHSMSSRVRMLAAARAARRESSCEAGPAAGVPHAGQGAVDGAGQGGFSSAVLPPSRRYLLWTLSGLHALFPQSLVPPRMKDDRKRPRGVLRRLHMLREGSGRRSLSQACSAWDPCRWPHGILHGAEEVTTYATAICVTGSGPRPDGR